MRGGEDTHGWGMVKKRCPARARRTNTSPNKPPTSTHTRPVHGGEIAGGIPDRLHDALRDFWFARITQGCRNLRHPTSHNTPHGHGNRPSLHHTTQTWGRTSPLITVLGAAANSFLGDSSLTLLFASTGSRGSKVLHCCGRWMDPIRANEWPEGKMHSVILL